MDRVVAGPWPERDRLAGDPDRRAEWRRRKAALALKLAASQGEGLAETASLLRRQAAALQASGLGVEADVIGALALMADGIEAASTVVTAAARSAA